MLNLLFDHVTHISVHSKYPPEKTEDIYLCYLFDDAQTLLALPGLQPNKGIAREDVQTPISRISARPGQTRPSFAKRHWSVPHDRPYRRLHCGCRQS